MSKRNFFLAVIIFATLLSFSISASGVDLKETSSAASQLCALFPDNPDCLVVKSTTKITTSTRGSTTGVITRGAPIIESEPEDGLIDAKKVIEECKRLAEEERKSPVGLIGRKFLGDDAIKGYLD